MALPPSLGPRLPSEPLSHPPGAPRELDVAGCTICSASGEERIRWPTPSSSEDPAGGRHREHLISGQEVLEAEQDSLSLCLLGLGLRLQDLEQGLGPWASAQSRMVQLQTLQADLRGAAERVDALLAFGEGLAQRSEPQARASLEQVLRALRAHRGSIFRRLWWLQAQLVTYSLVWPTLAVPAPGTNSTTPMTLSSAQVFEEANPLDQDLEVEGDVDGPGPSGVWGPWAPSSLPIPAELEWDPAGDVGGLRPLGRKTAWMPGAPCELCGHRGPQGRGQDLEDMLMSGFSHRKHLAGHRRRSLLRKSQDKKQTPPSLQDVMLEVDPGARPPASRQSLTFLLLFLLFLLVGATLLLPLTGGSCCSPARLARTPYLVLSYVNGPPPI
ncbi:nesprin-4 isoform X2 [Canis lupus baileyi]|uniref:nesprin-4 isoform X2 n=1 Tax=Canis lupus familiaris TaxID=9615 RepID=UPI0006B3C4A4|nr:nesprin-4 isoform X2 [Canis lupus familiaris]XP_035560107.1 nesprin-4 isoform X1 [Canis lupus dingo]XP_038385157.1 nesprin-4 isoform X2 [Canis lupus familiaris]XP_038513262.1 nesprin-4 isoform X2 [Canis lupus familiaris]XP_048966497.1 nesprin-4 isoform X1 [Canis lupus dingo]|eukprot:XP_013971268.1 nesprin-4 isoform X4 [Canis lupus familiaris]